MNLIYHQEDLKKLFDFEYDVIFMKDDQSSYLSPKQFKIFVNPFCEEIFKEIGTNNVYRMWHSDGTVFKNIDNIIDLKMNALNFFDPSVDISEFKEKVGGKVCLIGNVHPLKVLKNGSTEKVREECIRQIRIMKINLF